MPTDNLTDKLNRDTYKDLGGDAGQKIGIKPLKETNLGVAQAEKPQRCQASPLPPAERIPSRGALKLVMVQLEAEILRVSLRWCSISNTSMLKLLLKWNPIMEI